MLNAGRATIRTERYSSASREFTQLLEALTAPLQRVVQDTQPDDAKGRPCQARNVFPIMLAEVRYSGLIPAQDSSDYELGSSKTTTQFHEN
jgi:hypothetical protein